MSDSFTMKVCLVIKEKKQLKVLRQLSQFHAQVDLAEIWIDQLEDLNLSSLISSSTLPLLIVCKCVEEGGQFKGSWNQMADRLVKAIQYSPAYLDLPFQMPEELSKKVVQKASEKKTKIILSYHDFKRTPPLKTLKNLVKRMRLRHDDGILKIATYAQDEDAVIQLMQLALMLQKESVPHIILAMGPLGRVTRWLASELGNEIQYVVLKKQQATWGQLTLKEQLKLMPPDQVRRRH